jgi:hypothetical protein
MTNHESMKPLISGLSIRRYQASLKTERDESERQKIKTLLRQEELWLKRYTLKAN